jgi:hypothetical protein
MPAIAASSGTLRLYAKCHVQTAFILQTLLCDRPPNDLASVVGMGLVLFYPEHGMFRG